MRYAVIFTEDSINYHAEWWDTEQKARGRAEELLWKTRVRVVSVVKEIASVHSEPIWVRK